MYKFLRVFIPHICSNAISMVLDLILRCSPIGDLIGTSGTLSDFIDDLTDVDIRFSVA
jgi:hypothetical protein